VGDEFLLVLWVGVSRVAVLEAGSLEKLTAGSADDGSSRLAIALTSWSKSLMS
jgi:hypothetical protein